MRDGGTGSCCPQGRVCLVSSAGTGARAPSMDSVSLSSLLPLPARPVLFNFRGTETCLGSWLLPEGESSGKGFWCWWCSVAQSCPTLCDPMNCSTPGLPVIEGPKSKTLKTSNAGENVQHKELLFIGGRCTQWNNHFGR